MIYSINVYWVILYGLLITSITYYKCVHLLKHKEIRNQKKHMIILIDIVNIMPKIVIDV